MSEQRKRLTDDEVLEKYGLVRLSDPRLPALRRDHLKAIDDRKLLISLVSRSVKLTSGAWSKGEREAWEEIRREVKP